MLAASVRRREALATATVLQAFRDLVAAEARTAFDKGVGLLAAGDYGKAEASFKSADRS